LNVYRNTLIPVPGAQASILGYSYLGCYTDPSAASRMLSRYSFSNTAMTQTLCVSTCLDRGFGFAGVEYGKECYCGDKLNSIENGGKGDKAASEAECDMLCAGNKNETCGGGSRIGVWSLQN
jgi:hypothetical protein